MADHNHAQDSRECSHSETIEARVGTSQLITRDGKSCRQHGTLIHVRCKNPECFKLVDERYEWHDNDIECYG